MVWFWLTYQSPDYEITAEENCSFALTWLCLCKVQKETLPMFSNITCKETTRCGDCNQDSLWQESCSNAGVTQNLRNLLSKHDALASWNFHCIPDVQLDIHSYIICSGNKPTRWVSLVICVKVGEREVTHWSSRVIAANECNQHSLSCLLGYGCKNRWRWEEIAFHSNNKILVVFNPTLWHLSINNVLTFNELRWTSTFGCIRTRAVNLKSTFPCRFDVPLA